MRAPTSRATVSASRGERSVSKNTVVACVRRTIWITCCQLLRRGLGFWTETGDRDLLEAVAGREVAECCVARDDLVSLAVAQPLPVFTVELVAGRRRVRCRGEQRRADSRRHACEEDRIEPHVRVRRQTRLGTVCRVKRQPGEDVHFLAARLLDRLAHRRLEAMAEVEDDARVLDRGDFLRCQLQVVRLGSRRREVLDVERRPSDPLGGVGKGIERRNHRVRPTGAARPAARKDPGQDKNENYSRYHASGRYTATVSWTESCARNTRRRGLPQRGRPSRRCGAPGPPELLHERAGDLRQPSAGAAAGRDRLRLPCPRDARRSQVGQANRSRRRDRAVRAGAPRRRPPPSPRLPGLRQGRGIQ